MDVQNKKFNFYRIWFHDDLYKTFPVAQDTSAGELCLSGAEKVNIVREDGTYFFQLFVLETTKDKDKYHHVEDSDIVARHLEELRLQQASVDRLVFRVAIPETNMGMRARTLQRWTENMLSVKKLKVKDTGKAWSDGTLFVQLSSVIYRTEPDDEKTAKKPKTASQKLKNIEYALQQYKHHNAPLSDIDPQKLLKGHTESVVKVLWAVFLTYYGELFGFEKVSEFLFLEYVMRWISQVHQFLGKGKPQSKVSKPRSFGGLLMLEETIEGLALLVSQDKSLGEEIRTHPSTVKRLDILFEKAEEEVGVPRVLDISSGGDVKNIDSIALVIYLSVFHHRTLNKERIMYSKMPLFATVAPRSGSFCGLPEKARPIGTAGKRKAMAEKRSVSASNLSIMGVTKRLGLSNKTPVKLHLEDEDQVLEAVASLKEPPAYIGGSDRRRFIPFGENDNSKKGRRELRERIDKELGMHTSLWLDKPKREKKDVGEQEARGASVENGMLKGIVPRLTFPAPRSGSPSSGDKRGDKISAVPQSSRDTGGKKLRDSRRGSAPG
mmetsp:Transcript_27435/g.76688  ORF Transcript_27435/g.76688 Transcript_27435/m.76688 type:complete len:550 (-) Transcript_27435:32-1681(-)